MELNSTDEQVHELPKWDECCQSCGKKRATKLFDYVTGTILTSIDFQRRITTCDCKLCDDCAKEMGDKYDFCPKHVEEAKRKLEQWKRGMDMKTYEDLVDKCEVILNRGWMLQAVYSFMEVHSGWGPDSITFAIDEAIKRAASKS